ncbi:MAG: hypothetical protein K2N24_05535 [Lachnospiraceae bacterium]|nr:hypothetical protein [Lachnospiraceae bacterium]
MKLKTAKILSIILASIQLLTVLLTALITLNQYVVKQRYVVDTVILETKTIPIAAFCQSVIPLILYLILIWLLFMAEHKNTKMTAGILVLFGVVLFLTVSYLPTIENMLVGKTMGVEALASLSALNQAVTLLCKPFQTFAFALFCFVIGGYWGLQKEEA